MAHFIMLKQLDLTHDNGKSYQPVLFNLDTVISIEPSVSKIHSVIYTKNNSNGIRVKETLEEILKLSKEK
jgi:hypothetical protein